MEPLQPLTRADATPPMLLVVIGPSHAGKTSLAKELHSYFSSRVSPVIDIDEVLLQIAGTPASLDDPGPWIKSGYDRCEQAALEALRMGMSAIITATFTYIPPEPAPGMWLDRTWAHLLGMTSKEDVSTAVIRLTAPLQVLLDRQRRTGRLTPAIVEAIYHVYERIPVAPGEVNFSESADALNFLMELLAE